MKLLLLAGTAEARALASRLAEDHRFTAIASLAGATRAPAPYPVPTRHGGFGSKGRQTKWMKKNAIEAVLDATHPFARSIPARSQALCQSLGLPYFRLMRPGWRPGPGDDWTVVHDEAAAAAATPPGARVFLATGPRALARYAALAEGRHLIVRVIDPPDAAFPFPNGDWLVARPPFTVEDEIRTFRTHRVELLVAKNAGGPATAKLAAARALGLPVVLLDRPAPPPGDRGETVEDALAWLERLL